MFHIQNKPPLTEEILFSSWIVLKVYLTSKSHFSLDILVKQFPKGVQEGLAFAMDVFLFILIFDVMVNNGVYLTQLTLRQISPALGIRMSYVYSAVLACGTLSCFYILEDILSFIKDAIERRRERMAENV